MAKQMINNKEGSFKKYLSILSKKENSLLELAEVFKIPVARTRTNDYKITRLNSNDMSIEIVDRKNDITYTANYSKESEVLGLFAYEEKIKFINVLSKSPLSERTTVYIIGEEKPMLEKMTIFGEGKSLFFKRTMPDYINGFYRQDGKQFRLTYYEEDEEHKEQDLLTSVYKKEYTYKKIHSFERLYVASNSLTYDKNRPDHFCYDIEGNLISGNKFSNDELYIEGACFEKVTIEGLTEVFPSEPGSNSIKDYSHLDVSKMNSAILYAGYNFSEKSRLYNELEISKTREEIRIHYAIEDKTSYPFLTTLNEVITLSRLTEGSITIPEIESIILELHNRYSGDAFIAFVLNELNIFKEKLAIREELHLEVLFPLSPKILIDESFDKIQDLIEKNKNEYFNGMKKIFEEETRRKNKENVLKTLK